MDHGGKRPYPCPECSFTCKTKQQLNEHRRKHSVNNKRKKKAKINWKPISLILVLRIFSLKSPDKILKTPKIISPCESWYIYIYMEIISFWQGEKAYSCALCGTRFTYRNGLIKHTKLNRCPKRQNTPDSEKHNKKKNKDFGFAIHKEVNKLKISFFGGTFIQNWGYVGTGAWTLDSQCQNWRFMIKNNWTLFFFYKY